MSGPYSQWAKIEEGDIVNIWFEQDGATCHTAETVLANCFKKKIIWRTLYIWDV